MAGSGGIIVCCVSAGGSPTSRAAVKPTTYSIGESFSLRTREYDQVPLPSMPARLVRRATVLFAGAIFSGSAILTALGARPDQPGSDSVGVIEGESIAVSGPMRVEVVDDQVKTMLRSGSDVRVKSGTARIDLVEGGQISICGPAHLSVLKSGGSLTIALDTGTVHVRIEHELPLNIYTPLIQAQTIAIGDGPRDALVGFDSSGAMCIRANLGAIRVEQQLTGQSVIIPQTGDVFLFNGQLEQLRTSAGHCSCELQVARATPPPQPAASQPVAAEASAAKEEPIYQVFVPPLIFNASAEVQPDIDPSLIVIVRRVRVRPTLIFQGRVEGNAVASAPTPPLASKPAPAEDAANSPKPSAPANNSLVNRVRNFVRKLWPSGS